MVSGRFPLVFPSFCDHQFRIQLREQDRDVARADHQRQMAAVLEKLGTIEKIALPPLSQIVFKERHQHLSLPFNAERFDRDG